MPQAVRGCVQLEGQMLLDKQMAVRCSQVCLQTTRVPNHYKHKKLTFLRRVKLKMHERCVVQCIPAGWGSGVRGGKRNRKNHIIIIIVPPIKITQYRGDIQTGDTLLTRVSIQKSFLLVRSLELPEARHAMCISSVSHLTCARSRRFN
jgi:hypothetical protein